MMILGLESSAKSASVAVTRDGALLGRSFQCSGLTHSRTLLPMAEDLLRNLELTLADMDAIAVAQGPGSFTGVRIGVAAVKGLCWGADKPAIGVSTLEAMAWNGVGAPEGSVICCAMDARRSQVYNALFTFENGMPHRESPDRAIDLPALAAELKAKVRPVWVVGDGAVLCCEHLKQAGLDATLAPEILRWQDAWGVCRAAEGKKPESAATLLPVYLRLSQAERERLARMGM